MLLLSSSYLVAAIVLLLVKPTKVSSNAGVFTYYETPMFYRIGNDAYIMAHEPEVGFGPSQWRNIIFPPIVAPTGNQCGGIGQTTGYGQSPIVIPSQVDATCDTDLSGYKFEPGTCTWEQLNFRSVLNGVIVNATADAGCSMGRMKIPGNPNWFNALQYHIHTGSEHSVDGKYYAAELHVVHQEETLESFAVFGMFVDTDPNDQDKDHETFEYYLQGWEASARQIEEFCAANPEGTGVWGPNSVFESRQMKRVCPEPGAGIDPADIEYDEITGWPDLVHPNYPVNNTIPHIYEDLPTAGYGVYSYRGGLTTPPCTEIVNWNLLDTPLYASRSQVDRLYHLVLCMTEPTTCKHATIANEVGLTNRPVQELHERTIIHRCPDGPTPIDPRGVAVPISPEYGYNHNQVRRCIFNGEGGPLQLCWTDTVLEHFALIFPWFTMALGMVVFFILTRYVSWFPYTAMMFVLGVLFGYTSVHISTTDQLSQSIRMWEDIGAEVILLAFLPGLIFRDSYTSNVFLFQKAFWQCIVMAFPMVLCGTALTALVGKYILPYDWSWAFCFTFGAILSATDPVAVSSLLNEVGAPPRLKIHISGESLLNDGSAMVFFTIFSQMFEYELGIPGFGTDMDWATGIGLFLRMSLGAICIGILFSAGLLWIVYLLNRKFNYEESIVQVMASIASVYLCYYFADAVCATSGVVAVVTMGLITKFFSGSLFNDTDMMEKFWVLVEHMLNTILFTVGGMVWGRIISNEDPIHKLTFYFEGTDYAYMVLVWVFLIIIRYFLIFLYYPIIDRMGLRTNIRESIFMGWGGLRGAVGIALAIHLDSHIHHNLFRTDPRRRYTTQLFGIVGGVSFLTLVINGTLAGPLLKYLQLAKTGEARQEVARQYKTHIKREMFSYLLKLLGQPRFAGVDYAAVKKHISWFDDLTPTEIRFLVKRNKESTPVLDYSEPNLSSFKPFLNDEFNRDIGNIARASVQMKLKSVVLLASAVAGADEGHRQELVRFVRHMKQKKEQGSDDATDAESEEDVSEKLIELRKVFVDLIDKAYDKLFASGEVDVRDVLMVCAYKSSVEVTRDYVAKGHHIQDWNDVVRSMAFRKHMQNRCGKSDYGKTITVKLDDDLETTAKDLIHFGTGFIAAHTLAQAAFKSNNAGQVLTDDQLQVLEESQAQIEAAEASIATINPDRVTTIVAHLVCKILLNYGGELIGDLNEKGALKDQEAEHFLEEIQHDLDGIKNCHGEWVLLPCANEGGAINHKHGKGCKESMIDASGSGIRSMSGYATLPLDDVEESRSEYAELLAEKQKLEKLLQKANQELSEVRGSDIAFAKDDSEGVFEQV